MKEFLMWSKRLAEATRKLLPLYGLLWVALPPSPMLKASRRPCVGVLNDGAFRNFSCVPLQIGYDISVENLTKQQIVLVTLLVSFVTSLATGIITVSLMEQEPQGVT